MTTLTVYVFPQEFDGWRNRVSTGGHDYASLQAEWIRRLTEPQSTVETKPSRIRRTAVKAAV